MRESERVREREDEISRVIKRFGQLFSFTRVEIKVFLLHKTKLCIHNITPPPQLEPYTDTHPPHDNACSRFIAKCLIQV